MLRVLESLLNLIDDSVEHEADAERIDVVLEYAVGCRLLQHSLDDLHEASGDIPIHQWDAVENEANFCLVTRSILLQVEEERVENGQVTRFEDRKTALFVTRAMVSGQETASITESFRTD